MNAPLSRDFRSDQASAALPPTDSSPVHDAHSLTGRSGQARIVLDGKVYVLRITRQGKLILTK